MRLGTFGFNSGTFSGTEIGCLGGVLFVLFILGGIAGLLAMVWWALLGQQG